MRVDDNKHPSPSGLVLCNANNLASITDFISFSTLFYNNSSENKHLISGFRIHLF